MMAMSRESCLSDRKAFPVENHWERIGNATGNAEYIQKISIYGENMAINDIDMNIKYSVPSVPSNFG